MPKKYISHAGLASPFFNIAGIQSPKTLGIAYLNFSRMLQVTTQHNNGAYNKMSGKMRLLKNIYNIERFT